jgi:hypothetical protein
MPGGCNVAALIEFEKPRGGKSFVNPDYVVSVDEVSTPTHKAIISCVNGEKIHVKGATDEVKRKLGM